MELFNVSIELFLAVFIPFITVFVGAIYFVAPKFAFHYVGLDAQINFPEAFGEARSTFAGFLIALGALCAFFKEPILYFVLASAWGFVAFGKLIQIIIDGDKRKSTILRFGLSVFLSAGLFYLIMMNGMTLNSVEFNFNLLQSGIAASISAFVTLLFGLLCFLMPAYSAKLMRIRGVEAIKGSAGELRGNIAGFYLALSLAVLLLGGTHIVLALGICWLMTAFGRMVSMIFDGTSNLFNWLSLIVELSLACLPLLSAFGVL
ncbi:MAG: hypothetical protein AB8B49_09455 [Nitratireductor sp.]